MKPSLTLLVLASCIATLAGCVSQPPRPELINAAMPNPATPTSISGELLSQCLSEAYGTRVLNQQNVGVYSPIVTLGFTKEMARSGGPIVAYAPRIRAYLAKPYVKALFRSLYADTACFYELKDGQLRYLSFLRLNPGGSVRRDDLFGAINKAYVKMSGKDPVRLAIFGDYPDERKSP
jgi:hypothetical protein